MKIAISQPEHFPYLGYFQKMQEADLFVLLDHVRFSGPRSFQNRNRFLSKSGVSEWFTVPVQQGSYFQPLNKVKTAPDSGWRAKLRRKLLKRFDLDLEEIYRPVLLCDINLASIEFVRSRLGIHVPMIKSSSLSLTEAKSKLLVEICLQLGADTYVCGVGGRAYLDETLFANNRITVQYHEPFVEHHFTSLQAI